MGLKVMVQTLSARSQSFAFQCEDGTQQTACSIAAETLRDITDFHQFKGSPEEGFRALLPEIERLVNAKLNAGRREENGEISIRMGDLLRYGFAQREKAAA
jgi:hypothetical protein